MTAAEKIKKTATKKKAKKAGPKKNAPAQMKKATEPEVEVEILEPEIVDDLIIAALPEAKNDGVAPDKSLVPYTPLQLYLMEVRKISLLTREEEYELAVRFNNTKDPDAAYQLVTANLRLVVKIAMEYQRSIVNVMDLIQEGNIGLMQAVQKFDPYKNVKLSSYSAWWIKAYILRYILNNWRMVKIGTTQAQRKLFYNLQKEKDRLEAQGFTPTAKLLAQSLDVSQKEVIEMEQRMSHGDVSLDIPVSDDSKSTIMDLMPTSQDQPDQAVEKAESLEMVRQILDEFTLTLEGKERYLFEKRMTAEDPLTLQEIGDKFGVTRERIHQIESNLQKRLKLFLEERGISEA